MGDYTTALKVSAKIQGDWAKEIFINASTGVSQANKDEVYVGDTSPFTAGDVVRITDNTEQTGEDKIVDSITEDTYVKLTTNMTKDYSIANEGQIQIKSMFSKRTQPSLAEVDEIIDDNEDYIDGQTKHGWRVKTETNEYRDVWAMFRTLTGVGLFLKHRSIISFTKIEVWNGQSWVDWVAGSQIEGRQNDYWADYTDGILYLRIWFIPYHELSARITYTYGETTVPGDIKKCATFLSAADVLDGENFVAKHPAGDLDNISVSTKQSRFRRIAKDIIDTHRELYTF